MYPDDSAIAVQRLPLSRRTQHAGLAWGAVGVFAFSLTVPLTRLAVHDLGATFVGAGRAVVAGLLAGVLLLATRQRLPRRHEAIRLAVVAAGVVVGFPLCTSAALTEVPASHAAVVIGLLPAATAAMSVLRTRERVPLRFWVWALAGAVAVIGFIAYSHGGLGAFRPADVWLLVAVLLAAIGYAEGGLLARTLGSWQTICWALLLALPLMGALTAGAPVDDLSAVGQGAWAAFAYLSLVSMFLGFFAWYRGLALGRMAQVSQVQLVQPVLSLLWAGLLLGEPVNATVAVPALAVVACAAAAVRARVPAAPSPAPGGSRVGTLP
jgi:drug/metabolite transporter (DMT)-like permease